MGALRRSSEGRLSVLDEVLRPHVRHRRVWRAGLAAAALLAVYASLWLGPGRPGAGVAPTGAITGYIQPCSGLPSPLFTSAGTRLFSAAATVEALRGKEYLKPVGDGNYRWVFPAAVAVRERVSQNQKFQLDDLAPGRYVILAQYARGNASTSLDVSVAPGRVAEVDLPNPCI